MPRFRQAQSLRQVAAQHAWKRGIGRGCVWWAPGAIARRATMVAKAIPLMIGAMPDRAGSPCRVGADPQPITPSFDRCMVGLRIAV